MQTRYTFSFMQLNCQKINPRSRRSTTRWDDDFSSDSSLNQWHASSSRGRFMGNWVLFQPVLMQRSFKFQFSSLQSLFLIVSRSQSFRSIKKVTIAPGKIVRILKRDSGMWGRMMSEFKPAQMHQDPCPPSSLTSSKAEYNTDPQFSTNELGRPPPPPTRPTHNKNCIEYNFLVRCQILNSWHFDCTTASQKKSNQKIAQREEEKGG